jgi:hypothetical protein
VTQRITHWPEGERAAHVSVDFPLTEERLEQTADLTSAFHELGPDFTDEDGKVSTMDLGDRAIGGITAHGVRWTLRYDMNQNGSKGVRSGSQARGSFPTALSDKTRVAEGAAAWPTRGRAICRGPKRARIKCNTGRTIIGQFDSPTEATLTQLKIEHAAISPVGVVAERIIGIASKLLDLAGFKGDSVTSDLVFSLKGVAANKGEGNLIYFAEALVDDNPPPLSMERRDAATSRQYYPIEAALRDGIEVPAAIEWTWGQLWGHLTGRLFCDRSFLAVLPLIRGFSGSRHLHQDYLV